MMFKYHENTQGMFALIGDGLRLYTASLSKVLLWTFLFQLIIQSVVYLQYHHPKTLSITTIAVTILIFLLPIVLAPALAIIVFSHIQNTAMQAAKLSPVTALLRRFYWRTLGADLLCTLYMLLGIAVFVILGVISILVAHHHILPLVIIGLLLMIALIGVFPYLFFYKPFILFDGLSITQSIKASFKLVHSHWWRTVIVLIVPGFLLGVISIVVSVLAGKHSLIGFIVQTVISSLLIPLTFALTLVLFNDLKIRKSLILNKIAL